MFVDFKKTLRSTQLNPLISNVQWCRNRYEFLTSLQDLLSRLAATHMKHYNTTSVVWVVAVSKYKISATIDHGQNEEVQQLNLLLHDEPSKKYPG